MGIGLTPACINRFFQGGSMASGLTKTQLIRLLAEKTELPNKTAAAFMEHLADTAIKETKKNGIFVVPGLGRLVKAHRKARVGRNPQTGEPIQIKAKTVVKFRVAKAAKDAIAPKKYFLFEICSEGRPRPAFVFLSSTTSHAQLDRHRHWRYRDQTGHSRYSTRIAKPSLRFRHTRSRESRILRRARLAYS